MSQTCSYEHKKFSLKTEEYSHKKFGLHMYKRKHEDSDDKENNTTITAQLILAQAAKKQQHQPAAKRRQTKALFRPWLDDDKNKSASTKVTPQRANMHTHVLSPVTNNIMTYRPNMIRQFPAKQRSESEQQRRYRNTMACLVNRRNQQAEQLLQQQQYAAYQQQEAAMMQQSVRSALYLRHLQQLALQRQQQLFVFGSQ